MMWSKHDGAQDINPRPTSRNWKKSKKVMCYIRHGALENTLNPEGVLGIAGTTQLKEVAETNTHHLCHAEREFYSC